MFEFIEKNENNLQIGFLVYTSIYKMGQYFRFICLLKDNSIQFIDTFRHEGGCKLLEMCYLNNYYMLRMEKLLSEGGLWHRQRVVLAGEYAECEKGSLIKMTLNLYNLCDSDAGAQNMNPTVTVEECINDYCTEKDEFRYIVNHDTKEYVDKEKCKHIHPLAFLIADGENNHFNEFGRWAKQRISVEKTVYLDEFTEYAFDESEFEFLFPRTSEKDE